MAEQAVSNGCGDAEQPPTETIAASRPRKQTIR
jgi:hypothetical protein